MSPGDLVRLPPNTVMWAEPRVGGFTLQESSVVLVISAMLEWRYNDGHHSGDRWACVLAKDGLRWVRMWSDPKVPGTFSRGTKVAP